MTRIRILRIIGRQSTIISMLEGLEPDFRLAKELEISAKPSYSEAALHLEKIAPHIAASRLECLKLLGCRFQWDTLAELFPRLRSLSCHTTAGELIRGVRGLPCLERLNLRLEMSNPDAAGSPLAVSAAQENSLRELSLQCSLSTALSVLSQAPFLICPFTSLKVECSREGGPGALASLGEYLSPRHKAISSTTTIRKVYVDLSNNFFKFASSPSIQASWDPTYYCADPGHTYFYYGYNHKDVFEGLLALVRGCPTDDVEYLSVTNTHRDARAILDAMGQMPNLRTLRFHWPLWQIALDHLRPAGADDGSTEIFASQLETLILDKLRFQEQADDLVAALEDVQSQRSACGHSIRVLQLEYSRDTSKPRLARLRRAFSEVVLGESFVESA